MLAIDRIFEILCNGEWHRLSEVAEKAGTQESKVRLISSFLSAYDFLEFDEKTKKMRLSTQLHSFLEKIKEVEQKEDT